MHNGRVSHTFNGIAELSGEENISFSRASIHQSIPIKQTGIWTIFFILL